jgi:hypothetical protein
LIGSAHSVLLAVNDGALLPISMAALTLSLAMFPLMTTKLHLWIYASTMGMAGGRIFVDDLVSDCLFPRIDRNELKNLANET